MLDLKLNVQTTNIRKSGWNPVSLQPSYIIIDDSNQTKDQLISDYLWTTWSDLSTHYLVDSNWDIYKLSSLSYVTKPTRNWFDSFCCMFKSRGRFGRITFFIYGHKICKRPLRTLLTDTSIMNMNAGGVGSVWLRQ